MKKVLMCAFVLAIFAGVNIAFADEEIQTEKKSEQMKEVITEKASETADAVKVGAKKAGDATVRGAKKIGKATAKGAKKVGNATAKEAKKAGKATARGAKRAARATAKGINSSADKVHNATGRYVEKTTKELEESAPECKCGCGKKGCDNNCECK